MHLWNKSLRSGHVLRWYRLLQQLFQYRWHSSKLGRVYLWSDEVQRGADVHSERGRLGCAIGNLRRRCDVCEYGRYGREQRCVHVRYCDMRRRTDLYSIDEYVWR